MGAIKIRSPSAKFQVEENTHQVEGRVDNGVNVGYVETDLRNYLFCFS